MDKHLANVHQFHEIFGCSTANSPTLGGPLDYSDLSTVDMYAKELEKLAVRIKASAETAGLNQRAALRDYLTRVQLHVEETAELVRALADQDLVGALDALTDIDYVGNGTLLTLGMGMLKLEAHEAVHTSNLSKLDADGKPIIGPSGRVVKGPNYAPPTEALRALINREQGETVIDKNGN